MILDNITCHHSKVIGSGIGGIECTQEVIDLCAKNGIKPKIDVRPVSDLGFIYTQLGSRISGPHASRASSQSIRARATRRGRRAAPPA